MRASRRLLPHDTFRADLHNLERFGADIAETGIEPCAQGYALWIETTQGDVNRIILPTRAVAIHLQNLIEAS